MSALLDLERRVTTDDMVFFLRTIYKMRLDDAKALVQKHGGALGKRMGTEMPRNTAAWLWKQAMIDAN